MPNEHKTHHGLPGDKGPRPDDEPMENRKRPYQKISAKAALDRVKAVSPRVAKCARWELSPSAQYVVGSGMTECDFAADIELQVFEWLFDADWLDAQPVQVLPFVAHLTDLLEICGDIHWRQNSVTDVQSSASKVQSNIGVVGGGEQSRQLQEQAGRGAAPHVVELPQLVRELVLLRAGLVLAVGGTPEDVALGLFRRSELSAAQVPDDLEPARVRTWFQERIVTEPLVLVPEDAAGASTFNLAFFPASARQQLWLTLAVSCGVLDAPFVGPGVYRCAYRRCEKLFMSDRTGTRGTLRFCSERHGKAHHAAIAMQKQRLEDRVDAAIRDALLTPWAATEPEVGAVAPAEQERAFAKSKKIVAAGWSARVAAMTAQTAKDQARDLEPTEPVGTRRKNTRVVAPGWSARVAAMKAKDQGGDLERTEATSVTDGPNKEDADEQEG